jgi:predicted ATPase
MRPPGELSQLQNAFQRVTSNASLGEAAPGGSQVVLIEGASGSGKSALIEAFREVVVVDQNHIFCWGKFEENQAVTEPFSAFAECIGNLFDALCRKRPAWMDEMDDEASSHARVVAVILPHRFHHLLHATSIKDDHSSSSCGALHGLEFESQWGFERLRLAVKGLIRTICKIFLIVLLLEDLQWVGAESLTLLRTLLSDKQDKQFLFVGTIRGDGNGPTTDALANLKVDLLGEVTDDMKDQLHTIHLGNLSLHGVTEIVSSLLGKDPMDTQPLAEVVHRKTCGNTFFVVQFLRLLYERRLIDFLCRAIPPPLIRATADRFFPYRPTVGNGIWTGLPPRLFWLTMFST